MGVYTDLLSRAGTYWAKLVSLKAHVQGPKKKARGIN